ncbi:MAG: hypothetical protein KAJ79_04220, partial [Candidatus Omnitrophica bacterium]|nr:hypothetical protein [Candidatus Omnitrophota bacterium]
NDSRKTLSTSLEQQPNNTTKEIPKKIEIPVTTKDIKPIATQIPKKPAIISESAKNITEPISKEKNFTAEEIIIKPTPASLETNKQTVSHDTIIKKNTSYITPTVIKTNNEDNLPNFENLNLLPIKNPNED